jgi:hypothetical protein
MGFDRVKPTDLTTRAALGMLDAVTPIAQLASATTAVMCSIITVAGVFAEILVRKEILTADEAAAVLCEIAAEFRRDGGEENGRTLVAAYAMASDLEKRAAFAVSEAPPHKKHSKKSNHGQLRLVKSTPRKI